MFNTLCEIHGIDGDLWSLEQDGDNQFLMHTADADDAGPLSMIPVDEHVLEALLRASRAASVVVVVQFPGSPRAMA